MIRKMVSLFLIVVLLTATAGAQVSGEHSFWKEYIKKCVGTNSTFTFTQQEARAASQELTYFGSEYIRFSFGSYQNGEILMIGMDGNTLVCDTWDSLDDNKLTNIILKFSANLNDEESQEYIDDAAIMVEFNDGYSLIYWKSLFPEGWTLSDKNSKPVGDPLTVDDLFDIIPRHVGK